MNPEALHALFEANTRALEDLRDRIANLEARFDQFVKQINDHLDIEWATRREVEEIRVGILPLKGT